MCFQLKVLHIAPLVDLFLNVRCFKYTEHEHDQGSSYNFSLVGVCKTTNAHIWMNKKACIVKNILYPVFHKVNTVSTNTICLKIEHVFYGILVTFSTLFSRDVSNISYCWIWTTWFFKVSHVYCQHPKFFVEICAFKQLLVKSTLTLCICIY